MSEEDDLPKWKPPTKLKRGIKHRSKTNKLPDQSINYKFVITKILTNSIIRFGKFEFSDSFKFLYRSVRT